MIMDQFKLGFKMHLWFSGHKWTLETHCCSQLFVHKSPKCPADYLGLDYVTSYVTSVRRIRYKNVKPVTYSFLHSNQISDPIHFECWHAVTKTTSTF